MAIILWVFRGRRPVGLVTVPGCLDRLGLGDGARPRIAGCPEDHGRHRAGLGDRRCPDDFDVPVWVILSVTAALAAGTWAGGWRIIRTLGRRIVHLDSPRGFAAEGSAAAVLYVTAFVFAAPVSTTHT